MKEINYKGLDWYVLEEKDNITKLLLKNVLDDKRISKYADDEFMYNGHDVRHQDTIRPFEWGKSYIKNTILPNFLKDLGVEGKIDLLSVEEVRELPDEVKKCNDWYWTKSRISAFTYFVFFVNFNGIVSGYGVNSYSGVRPVLYLESVNFSDGDARRESCRQKIDKLEFEDIEEIKMIGCNVKINILDEEFVYGTDTSIVTEHCISKINQLIKNQKKIIERIKDAKVVEKAE